MASASASQCANSGGKGFLSFIPHPLLRKIIEIIISAIPGGLVFFIFIVGTGALNVFSNLSSKSDVFTATYVPVICILPFVIGVIGPLVLERVRGQARLSLRSSAIVSFLSGFFGSLLGALALLVSSLAASNLKPFGDVISDLPTIAGALLVLVIVTSVLSTIGGAIIVALLNKVEK